MLLKVCIKNKNFKYQSHLFKLCNNKFKIKDINGAKKTLVC